jgi:ribosomal protein S21
MYVEVKGDKLADLDRALQQFTKQVKKAELMEDLKKKEFYLKKSKRLAKKSQDALRRRKREESKAQKKSNNTF